MRCQTLTVLSAPRIEKAPRPEQAEKVMNRIREVGHAPRVRALAREIDTCSGPCIGCNGCDGLCEALIEALVVPHVVLKDRSA